MDLALDILSWVLIICGSVFAIIGGIGIIRLPDFFTRIHAAGVIETMGAGAIFVGLILQAGWSLIAAKLALVAVFMIFTNPTATHAIARAALGEGLIPLTDDEVEEDLSGYVLSNLDMLELEADDKETDPSKT